MSDWSARRRLGQIRAGGCKCCLKVESVREHADVVRSADDGGASRNGEELCAHQRDWQRRPHAAEGACSGADGRRHAHDWRFARAG